RNTFADTLGDQSLYLCLDVVLRSVDPDPTSVTDAALGCIVGVDLDKHVLLQLGKPPVRASFLTTPLVLDETSGRQDDRERFCGSIAHSRLLHTEADIG